MTSLVAVELSLEYTSLALSNEGGVNDPLFLDLDLLFALFMRSSLSDFSDLLDIPPNFFSSSVFSSSLQSESKLLLL